MTYEEMMDSVIRRFGFEHTDTIEFCRMVEYAEREDKEGYLKAMVEGFYEGLMR